jgi:hypothetical protein
MNVTFKRQVWSTATLVFQKKIVERIAWFYIEGPLFMFIHKRSLICGSLGKNLTERRKQTAQQ